MSVTFPTVPLLRGCAEKRAEVREIRDVDSRILRVGYVELRERRSHALDLGGQSRASMIEHGRNG